jgi:glycosyltransferase involved in cell wall biosynthesis
VGGWFLDRLACRAGIRLLDDPTTTFCVLSTAETTLFPQTWRIDPRQVVYTPFCHTLSAAQLNAPLSEEIGVFAGGDSMRDYAPLLEAARGLRTPVRIAAVSALKGSTALPSNVGAGAVSAGEFFDLLRRSRIVVVPMRRGICRSAGQQTYLNAMALGKLVIVTDSPGARDYVEHGVTGLIVPPGDADALAAAIAWGLDPRHADEIRAIGRRARDVARVRFSPAAHLQCLFRVVEQAAG